jgi:gluconate 2-dehydrogenase gamma chain
MTALLFFNPVEAATIDALAARIIPGDEQDPGGHEARAYLYVDRALAGFARELQTFYRHGLRDLDDACVARFGGRRFVELTAGEQDELLGELDAPARDRSADGLGQLFAVVREHVVQGWFCDPVYGGNHDTVGWKTVGFPGARWGYTAEQMARGFDATTIPVTTLDDLYDGDRSGA